MKKLFFSFSLFAFVFVIGLPGSFAAYIIHLKSGGQFVVYQYWEKGDQIRFYKYGGEVGVAADFVQKIEEVDAGQVVESEGRGIIDEASSREEAEESSEEPAEEKASAAGINKEEVLEQKNRLVQEIESVSRSFEEAKAEGKKEEKEKKWQELLELQNKLSALRKQVTDSHQGKLPEWWVD